MSGMKSLYQLMIRGEDIDEAALLLLQVASIAG